MQDVYISLIDDILDESEGTKDQASETGRYFECVRLQLDRNS